MARPAFAQNIKSPNVSGQFYDADAQKLSAAVETYVKTADVLPSAEDVEILIAPHAGYVYSGPVAGYSFKTVSQKKFKTIVILAPSHFYAFDGASVWTQGGFKTPLGVALVDEDFSTRLSAMDPKFTFVPAPYEKEHALEVEIPFLQKTFADFKIVPVIIGQMNFENCRKLADALNSLIGNRKDVLVVLSSDMSHYHDDKTARAMDMGTLEIIKKGDAQKFYQQSRLGLHEMCGMIPVTVGLILAEVRGLQAKILKYANSGDVTQDKARVVGYGSVIFYPQKKPTTNADAASDALTLEQKQALLKLARLAIEEYVTSQKVFDVTIHDPRLDFPEGAFVTIHKNGQLRGCIGHIVSEGGPLQKTVRDMAIAAATADPRFPPVQVGELKDLDLEISVLSRPWRVKNIDEIKMGVHGVLISRGKKGGVFLPQVATETHWTKEKFLSELCSQKAGFPADCWKNSDTVIEIFTADVFGERDSQ